MQKTSPRRAQNQRGLARKRSAIGALVCAFAIGSGLVATSPALAGPLSVDADFELGDGNLAPDPSGDPLINFDWNSAATVSWSGGTSPKRFFNKTVSGWKFTGLEDAQAVTSDSAFAGGTKQDNECAAVGAGKAPNKDDLKRVYVSSTTLSGGDRDGHVILGLAWVRIPQNTTSASAHVGFEFNKATPRTPPDTVNCAGTSGLVKRTPGDMLIVYDFEGGSGAPVITLRRWVTSGACDVGSNSPPCWGTSTNLTAGGQAVASVNTGATNTIDLLAPPAAPATTSVSQSLADSEFGEAGIDLTAAGVFSPNVCESFGKVYAVSRSSGQSSTAQMKDLVGPGDINITNCGSVIIRKVTVPSPDPTDTTFSYSTTGGLVNPTTFTLKNGQSKTVSNVFAGSYSVTESDPGPNFELSGLDCSASSVTHGTVVTPDLASRTVSFTLQPEDTVDCTYTNRLKLGAIKVTKMRKHQADGPGDHPHAGVDFTVNGVTRATDANGVACFDGLLFGTYTVHESVPAGYSVDANDKQVTVDNAATCSGNPYVGETVSFQNTPLTDITIAVDSKVAGGTKTFIDCTPLNGAGDDFETGAGGDGTHSLPNLAPGNYVCEIFVDP